MLDVLPLGTLLSDVALNAVAATRTFTIGPALANGKKLEQYDRLALHFVFTHANNGTISAVVTEGAAADSATGSLTRKSWSGSTATLSFNETYITESLSADKSFSVLIETGGARALQVVVAHGGAPNASDKITVTGELLAGAAA